MRSWKNAILICAVVLTILPSARAQKSVYQSFNGEVPFDFKIGDRKFHAGYYEFLVLGPGIMAMRDRRAHVLATLITRQLQGEEREVAPHFVFEKSKGKTRLASIWMAKGAQGYEIVREDVPLQTLQPKLPVIVVLPTVNPSPVTWK